MAILVGLHAPETAAPQAAAHWRTLTAGLGAPIATGAVGPLRAALFAQHPGERARCPAGVPGPEGFPLGFGGDGQGTPPARLVPPWLVCRWDPVRRAAVVETDRHGFAPVYVRVVGDCVAFGSSAAALGRLSPRSSLDPSALAEMLAFDHLLGERTLRREVTAVPVGCALEIGPAGVSMPRRFRYSDLTLERRGGARAAVEELITLWREAVAAALSGNGDAPVVVPLSGGLDSRLLAATARDAGARVETFTFARAGDRAPDTLIAEQVARTLGASWRALGLENDWIAEHSRRAVALTDGQLDVLHAHGISLLDEFVAGRLRLDGFAGDLVLGGSFLRPELIAARTPERRLELLWRTRSRLERPEWLEILLPEARGDLLRRAREGLAQSLQGEPANDPRWSDFWALTHRVRRFTLNGPLLWNPVARSVFAFFAPGFIDRLLAVHPDERLDAALQTRFFWRGFPQMAEIPWQRTGRPVPRGGLWEAIARRLFPPAHRPGATFFDGNAAFRASPRLRAFMRELLLDPRAGVARFDAIDRASVARLLSGTEAGSRKGITQICLLATLVLAEEIWSP